MILGLLLSPFAFGALHTMIVPSLGHFAQYEDYGRNTVETNVIGDPRAAIETTRTDRRQGVRASHFVYAALAVIWLFVSIT